MNWLITGGCGFIGKNLIKTLLSEQKGYNIRIIDNFSVGQPSDLDYAHADYEVVPSSKLNWNSTGIQIVKGDILDADLAYDISKNADVIIHLAANTGVGPSVENPRMDCENNVMGTFNYLDAARKNQVKRFVFASSGAPIGECTPPIHEEMPCHPVSPYGASKLAGEAYCSAYNRTYGLDTVVLRFGNVYGPGSTHKSSVVAKFIRQAINGETLEIYGDGSQTRDFINVSDLVNAIILSNSTPNIGGEIFQIATNKESTVNEISDLLSEILIINNVKDFQIKHGQSRLGDVQRNFSDTTKAKQLLNWDTKKSLSEGLQETVEWFLD